MRRLGPRHARRTNRRSAIMTASAGSGFEVAASGGGGATGRLGPTTNSGDGTCQSTLQIGAVFTASQTFTMTQMFVTAGTTGIVAGTTVRLNIYAVAGTAWGALLGTTTIAGGFSASQTRSAALGASVSIVSGSKYGLSCHSSASCTTAFSADSASVFWSDAYADGPDNPSSVPNPGANFGQTPLMWGTD